MRVAVAGMYHETNTFALEHNDKLDAHLKVGDDVINKSHPKSFIGGFVEGMQGSGIEVVPTVEVRFHHGGLVHADVFEHYRDMIVDALKAAQPLDAGLLCPPRSHGVRGPIPGCGRRTAPSDQGSLGDVPIVATYDFHAIMSEAETHLPCGGLSQRYQPPY